MNNELRTSVDSFKDTLNDIKMFSQYSYCYDYIKINHSNLTDDKIKEHAEISSASFRQSLEFLNSALNTSISTSPLLYSYCLNNLIKGAIYLKSFDDDILNNFKKHGFAINDQYLKDNLLDTSISLWKSGVTTAILSVMNNHIIEPQQIKFSSLLSRIPEISDIYFKTTKLSPFVAIKNKTVTSDYEIPCVNVEDNREEQEIYNNIGLIGTYSQRDNKLYCSLNLRGKNYIQHNNLEKDVFYNSSIVWS